MHLDESASRLDSLFWGVENWTTKVAIIVFLLVGFIETVWKLAVHPLLSKFSSKYRAHLLKVRHEEILPVLQELGLVEKREQVRGLLSALGIVPSEGQVDLKERLRGVLKKHFTMKTVDLGKLQSVPNPYFIDLREASVDPPFCEFIANLMANHVRNKLLISLAHTEYRNFERVIGIKEGNPLFASTVAKKLNKPLSLFRGSHFPKFHASAIANDYFDGQLLRGENVILLDDCTFRGTTLQEAFDRATATGARVVGVFLLFMPHFSPAKQFFATRGIDLQVLMELTEAEVQSLQ